MTHLEYDNDYDITKKFFFDELFAYDFIKVKELLNIHENRACFVTNNFGHIYFVNKKWCQLCEYDKEDVIGHNLNILQGTKTDKKKVYDFLERLKKQDKTNMEIINYSKSKKELNLYVEAHKLNDNICFGFIEEINN